MATGSVTWPWLLTTISVIRGDTDAVATGHQLYLNTPNGIIDVNPKNGATKFTMAGATSIDAVSGTTGLRDLWHQPMCVQYRFRLAGVECSQSDHRHHLRVGR